ncbi:MAG: beta-galactosidase [Moraxellaceae bacterium]|nr:beta-galactosidase [Moraxellaceae bacterium]
MKASLILIPQICVSLLAYVKIRFVCICAQAYITNEMDGGGIPAWLIAKSTKRHCRRWQTQLRTHDPDYLNYLWAKYLRRVNAEVRDLFADRGGLGVLYSVENEYNWFQPFHRATNYLVIKVAQAQFIAKFQPQCLFYGLA